MEVNATIHTRFCRWHRHDHRLKEFNIGSGFFCLRFHDLLGEFLHCFVCFFVGANLLLGEFFRILRVCVKVKVVVEEGHCLIEYVIQDGFIVLLMIAKDSQQLLDAVTPRFGSFRSFKLTGHLVGYWLPHDCSCRTYFPFSVDSFGSIFVRHGSFLRIN